MAIIKGIFAVFSLVILITHAQDCVPRKFDEDSIVCVCNSTYCDSVTVDVPEKGNFRTYTSSRSGQRFKIDSGAFSIENVNSRGVVLILHPQTTFQSVEGFGGAFTDSSGLNIDKLSRETQELLIKTYFGEDGNRYNLCRVPVGGTDFSTRPYTLDDNPGDVSLSNFSLASEDMNYKMKYMKIALEVNPEIKFISASWTAPPWMKTNNDYTGIYGLLKKQYYQIYAEYLVKFLEDYKNEGLPIWAISIGNEPANVFVPLMPINDMGWLPAAAAKFLTENLGPTIANSSSSETLIFALDDQRIFLPWYITDMYSTNPEVNKYIAGIAVHWYSDPFFPPTVYDRTHTLYPNKPIIMTEACNGFEIWETKRVKLGSWTRGERYMSSIIEDLNHWVTGWIDWNLALDKQGGPNWVKNYVDSSIIVNPETDEFFKQPTYYALGHFSKFIPRGSTRVDLTESLEIESIAFSTPDNDIVIVLFNKNNEARTVTIYDSNQGHINVQLPERSFQTIIYHQ